MVPSLTTSTVGCPSDSWASCLYMKDWPTDQCSVEFVRVALRVRRVDTQRHAVGEDRYQNEILERSGGTILLRQQTARSVFYRTRR